MIKSWLFDFFHALRGVDEPTQAAVKQHFDNHFKIWTGDEALGFEGIMFSEHHFGPGYSPAPHLLVAAMADRTSTLRLGTLGVSTAYVSALRIVEEAAMLDQLTNGRFELGMVRGIPTELALLGLSLPEGDELFDKTLRTVDAALRTANDAFQCEGLVIQPPLVQKNLPKWVAVVGERSARRAAAMGWKACTGFTSNEAAGKVLDGYREEAGLDRAAAADMLAVRRAVAFVKDRSEAASRKEEFIDFAVDYLKDGPRAAVKSDVGQAPLIDMDAAIRNLMHADEFVVGTPQDVADEIIHQCRTIGCGHFMARLYSSDDWNQRFETHRIYGEQVIPILRKANLFS